MRHPARVRGYLLVLGLGWTVALAHCGDDEASGGPSASVPDAATPDGHADANGGDASTDANVDGGPGACAIAAHAGAPGSLDPSYENGVHPLGTTFSVRGALMDAQGRVYVFGATNGCVDAGLGFEMAVVRLTEGGAFDATFGNVPGRAGLACVDVGADDVADVAALDSSGRIVVAGVREVAAGVSGSVAVARFTSNGTVDATFGGVDGGPAGAISFVPPGGVSPFYAAYGVATGPGDVVYVSGGNANINNQPSNPSEGFLVRLTASGTFDAAFTPTLTSGFIGFGAVRPVGDGVLVSTALASPMRIALRKYGLDGTFPAAGFGTSGMVTQDVDAEIGTSYTRTHVIALQPDGHILVSGRVVAFKLVTARFSAAGAVDGTFGSAGIASDGTTSGAQHPRQLALQCDDRILVSGAIGLSPHLTRYLANGKIDPAFGDGGFTQDPDAGDAVKISLGYSAVLSDPRDRKIVVVAPLNPASGFFVQRMLP